MRVGITQKHNTNMHSYLTENEINQINFKGRKTGFKMQTSQVHQLTDWPLICWFQADNEDDESVPDSEQDIRPRFHKSKTHSQQHEQLQDGEVAVRRLLHCTYITLGKPRGQKDLGSASDWSSRKGNFRQPIKRSGQ